MRRRHALLLLSAVAVLSLVVFASQYTAHDSGVITFTASLNATQIQQNQTLRVYLDQSNTLYFRDSPPPSSQFESLDLQSGACPGLYSAGIAVYYGAFDLANVSSAVPIQTFYDSFMTCPMVTSVTSAPVFSPHQEISEYQDLDGYWTSGSTTVIGGGSSFGVLSRFQPGVYTVVAGDRWGATQVLHFRVVPTVVSEERSGPIATFPASWVEPCNAVAGGNLTTGVYLTLNSTSSLFDRINLDQVYDSIVGSPDFVYATTGHGWVVSEWTETSASGGETSEPAVIVTFVVLTGNHTEGYLYAYYYLASGTSAISRVQTIDPAGCQT